MKEKRVDFYLALASTYHLMVIGFGGAFLNEIIQDRPRMLVVIPAGLISITFALAVIRSYVKAKALSRKSKKIKL